MKKILILANSDGGLYHFRKELIETLVGQGYELYISLPGGDFVDLLQQLGCRFLETPIDRRGVNPITDIKLIFKYLNMIRQIKPNVVLTYTIKPNIYGSIACRIEKIPYLNNITGLGSGFLNEGLLTKLLIIIYRSALKKSETVFFQNGSDMTYMLNKRMISGTHKLIPGSGVNLDYFTYVPYPPENGRLIFNFIGRVMKDKGIDEYLTAARSIKPKYPETQFNIIGNVEPTQAHYRDLIAEFEENGWVKYWGYQNDIRQLIIDSHCTIQPSYSEGMSNVLLESAATGRVLIASSIPGCKETIDVGVNGYTFKVKDANDLTEKIEQFIKLPYAQKAEMGKNGRQKVEREFDRQIVINNYLEKINRIIS